MFHIRFNSPAPTMVVFLFFAVIIFFVIVSYVKLLRGRKTKVFIFLHSIAAFLLLCSIFQPEISLTLKTRVKRPVFVLIDSSISMRAKDKSGISKIDRAKEFLKKNKFLKKYRPVFYSFGADIKEINQKDIPLVKAEENATKIGESLSNLVKQHSTDCSGIVLISDGYENQFVSWQDLKNNLTLPVYTIGIGQAHAKDLAVSTVITNSPLYEGETLKISPVISQKGFDNEKIAVSLKENGKLIQGKNIEMTSNFVSVDFEVTSLSPGDYIYEVSVQPGIGETNLENNRFIFLVRVISPVIHVLYVEGSLRWEYKFLKRFLESDKKLDTCSLVRVGESTFQQTGGKTINIPSNILADEKFLENFDIIIFGDIDFSSFSDNDISNLADTIEKKGTGVLFLGGENFLKGLNRASIKELIPVKTTQNETLFVPGPIKPQITDEGKNLSIFEPFQPLPLLDRINMLTGIKPGGIVLMEDSGQKNTPILVATIRAKGKCVIVGTDCTWKWYYGADENEKIAYEKFWGRIIRFLCNPDNYLKIGDKVPDIILDKRIFARGEKVNINFVFNGKPNPFKAYVNGPDNFELNLNPENNTASFVPEKEGVYIICAEGNKKINKKEIVVTKQGSETEDPKMDDIYLKKLAEISGGQYFSVENADGLKKTLSLRKNTIRAKLAVTDETEKYLIPLIFVILSICWFLRRQGNIL